MSLKVTQVLAIYFFIVFFAYFSSTFYVAFIIIHYQGERYVITNIVIIRIIIINSSLLENEKNVWMESDKTIVIGLEAEAQLNLKVHVAYYKLFDLSPKQLNLKS